MAQLQEKDGLINRTGGSSRCRLSCRRTTPRPASTASRLVLDINTAVGCGCKSQFAPLAPSTIMQAPEAILKRGVEQATWTAWMQRLNDEIKNDSMSLCTRFMLSALVVTWPLKLHLNNNLQRRVAAIIDEFNSLVLHKLGMHAMTQKARASRCCHREVAWLAIALDEAESKTLKQEGHLFWYNASQDRFVANTCRCRTRRCGTLQVV